MEGTGLLPGLPDGVESVSFTRQAVAADDAGGAYPFDLTGAARLFVDDADAEDAAAILSDAKR